MSLMKLLLVFFIAGVVAGQDSGDVYRSVRTAMEMSTAKQLESVQRQVSPDKKATDDFFIVPWPAWEPSTPLSMPVAIGEPSPAVNRVMLLNDCNPIPLSRLQSYIETTARREGLSPELIHALIDAESAYYPCAVSVKGAQGLMQLMPETAAEVGVRDPFNPKANIDGGAKFLRKLLSRYSGDLTLALAAYNAGPARVDQYQGLPPIPETLKYVSYIMDRLEAKPITSPTAPVY